MDTVLEYADDYLFDNVYAKLVPAEPAVNATLEFATSALARDSDLRIAASLMTIVTLGGWAFYLLAATLSYYFIFDHEYMKHPKFLKNQVRLEIECAVKAVPGFARTCGFVCLFACR